MATQTRGRTDDEETADESGLRPDSRGRFPSDDDGEDDDGGDDDASGGGRGRVLHPEGDRRLKQNRDD